MSSKSVMKVVVVDTGDPFAERQRHDVVAGLESALLDAGHRVATYRFPFVDDWQSMPEQLTTLRLIDVPEGDRMIAVGASSWVIMHPQKVVWFARHYHGAYDQFGLEGGIPDTPRGRATRDAIRRADDVGLDQARRVFAASAMVADALNRYNSIGADVLPPPISTGEVLDRVEGDYILVLGDLEEWNRQALAIEAMRHVRSPVRMIVAGSARAETAAYTDGLRRAVAEYSLGGRVEIIDIPDAAAGRQALVARALAVVSVPWRESSASHAVLEAAAAGKPVVTASDSGCGLEIVGDGESGWVCDPLPHAIAACFDEAFSDRRVARERGTALAERVRELQIDWPATVERLLA